MSQSLTKRQNLILSVVEEYLRDNGESPTLPEIMAEVGITTKKGVAFHLDALEKKGYITRNGRARGIRLVSDRSGDFLRVQLLGYANAGEPLVDAKEEFVGELLVDKKLLHHKRSVFGVELRGDSMNQESLNGTFMENGNYILVAKDVDVSDGDIVVAMVNGGATVKTYHRDDKTVILAPNSSNTIHKPIYVKSKSDLILGKVLTVLNNPSNKG